MLVALLVACSSPRVITAPTPAPAAPVASGPRLRVDRPAERIGGPPTWADATEIDAMRLCRDDSELLVIDRGWLRRYRTADGSLVAETEIGESKDGANRRPTIDCRGSDGAALVVTGAHSPEIVDAAGSATAPPQPIAAIGAMFTHDGAVRTVDDDGAITEWRGSAIAAAGSAGDALEVGITEGGTVLAYGRTGKNTFGWTMIRDGVRTQLPAAQASSEAKSIAMAPDGTFAIEGELGSIAWLANRQGYFAGKTLYDGGGARLGGIAASDRGFAVLQGDLYYRTRYAFKWRDVGQPCDSFADVVALDAGDHRAYVGCPNGVHVIDVATGKASGGGDTAQGGELAWSPGGERIAIRGTGGHMTVWSGTKLIQRFDVDVDDHGTLWWTSPSELGGTDGGRLVAWPLATGTEETVKPELDAHLLARLRDGTFVSVQRHMQAPEWTLVARGRSIPIEAGWIGELAVDPAGTRALVAIGQYNERPWKSLVAFDLATGSATPYAMEADAIAAGDGVLVIARGDSATILHDGDPRTIAHGAAITALALGRGVIALGGADGSVSLWTTDGAALGKLTGARGELDALAVSQDGSHLAATGVDGAWSWNLAP